MCFSIFCPSFVFRSWNVWSMFRSMFACVCAWIISSRYIRCGAVCHGLACRTCPTHKPCAWNGQACKTYALVKAFRLVFWIFFGSGFVVSALFPGTSCLVFASVWNYHFEWYVPHFGMVTLHSAWYLLHLAMFAFHFAYYLPRSGTSTSHLLGICYILVLQTFLKVSLSFHSRFHGFI